MVSEVRRLSCDNPVTKIDVLRCISMYFKCFNLQIICIIMITCIFVFNSFVSCWFFSINYCYYYCTQDSCMSACTDHWQVLISSCNFIISRSARHRPPSPYVNAGLVCGSILLARVHLGGFNSSIMFSHQVLTDCHICRSYVFSPVVS